MDHTLVWMIRKMFSNGARVLDIGSNFGETLLAFPCHCKLEGIELSTSAAKAASKKHQVCKGIPHDLRGRTSEALQLLNPEKVDA